jgi:hypothetical protein
MKRLLKNIGLRALAWYADKRYGAAFTEDALGEPILDTSVAPPRTHEMKMRGTVWALMRTGYPDDDGVPDVQWREVCDTCGGNCGQCGMTERLGNPGFSLDRIIEKTGMNKPVAGLPTGER